MKKRLRRRGLQVPAHKLVCSEAGDSLVKKRLRHLFSVVTDLQPFENFEAGDSLVKKRLRRITIPSSMSASKKRV